MSIWPFIIYQNKMHSCSTHWVPIPAMLPFPSVTVFHLQDGSITTSVALLHQGHTVYQSQSRYNQQITVSTLQLHSTDIAGQQHNRTQEAGGLKAPPHTPQLFRRESGGCKARASEQQRGQDKQPIRIRAGLYVPSLIRQKGFHLKGDQELVSTLDLPVLSCHPRGSII